MQEDTFLTAYVAECVAHLETVEADLIEIERVGAGAPELVNRVFRAAHAIKGGAGFFELQPVKDLALKLENVLEMVRSGGLAPNPEVVNQLLQGFDKMKLLFANIHSVDDVDVGDEILALTGLASSYLPQEKKEQAVVMVRYPVPGSRLELQVSELLVDFYRSAGNSITILLFDLIHDVERLGKQPSGLLAQIDSLGMLLDCGIDIFGVGTLDQDVVADRVPFYVLLATSRPVPELAQTLGIAVENIRPGVSRSSEGSGQGNEPEGTAGVIDRLIRNVSQLILARDALLEAIRVGGPLDEAARRIDAVTAELQEAVLRTRTPSAGTPT